MERYIVRETWVLSVTAESPDDALDLVQERVNLSRYDDDENHIEVINVIDRKAEPAND